MDTTELKPASVYKHFAEVNKTPRAAKRDEKMIEYLQD